MTLPTSEIVSDSEVQQLSPKPISLRQKAVMVDDQCEIDLSLIPYNGVWVLEHEGKELVKIISEAGQCEIHCTKPQHINFTKSYQGQRLQLNLSGNAFFKQAQKIQSLDIQAASVRFEQAVQCADLKINVKDTVSIKNELSVKQNLEISAAVVKNTGNVKTADKSRAKITASKMFYTESNSSSIFRGSLLLESDYCQIKGKCGVIGDSEIKAKRLDNAELFQLKHAKKLEVQEWNNFKGAKTKLNVTTDTTIKISDTTRIAQGAHFKIQGGYLDSYQIENQGELEIESTIVASENFLQKKGNTRFNQRSILNLTRFQVEDGELAIERSQLNATEWIQTAGQVQAIYSTLAVKNALQVDKAAVTHLQQTELRAKQTLGFGTIHLEHSQAEVENWYHDGQAVFKNSSCTAKKGMSLTNKTRIKKTQIISEDISLIGDIEIEKASIESKKCVLRPNTLKLDRSLLKADELSIYKGEGVENAFEVNQTEINSGALLLNADLKLIKSKLITREIDKTKKTSQGVFGKLILEESLLQTEGNVQLFSSSGAKISANNKSEIHANEVYSWGGLDLKESMLQSDKLYQSKGEMSAQQSKITTKELAIDSKIRMDESRLDTDSAGFSGQIDIRTSAITVKQNSYIHNNATVKTNTSSVTANQMNIQGSLHQSVSHLQVNKELVVGSGAHLDEDHSQAQVGSLALHGHLREKNAAIASKGHVLMSATSQAEIDGGVIQSDRDIDIYAKEMKLTGDGVKLQAKGNVYTGETAHILGSNMEVDSIVWTHQGNLKVDGLNATGKRFYNAGGSIKAKNAKFGYDHFWFNFLGDVSTDHLVVHSNMLNLGLATADNMQVSGFINMNAGLIAAKNYQESGLISLNVGGIVGSNIHRSALLSANFGGILAIPTLPTSAAELFSWNNLSRVINIGASIYMPDVAGLVNFGTHSINTLINLPQTIKTISNVSSQIVNMKSMRLHEIMPLANQVKDLAMSASQYTSIANQGWSNYAAFDWGKTQENFATASQGSHWGQALYQASNLFGGNIVEENIFHYNAGGMLARNITDYSYGYQNDGTAHAWDSLGVNSTWINNTSDLSAGVNAVFTAKDMTNSGDIEGGESTRITIENELNNTEMGNILSNNKTSIKAGTFNQEGNAVLHHGVVDADIMNIGGKSQNDYDQLQIKGTELHLAAGHQIHTHDVMIEEMTVTRAAGDWKIDGYTQMDVKNYTSTAGAVYTVAQSPIEENNVPQTNTENTDAPKADGEENTAPPRKNIFILNAQTGTVSDTVNGGDAAVLNIDHATFKNAELNGKVYANGKTAEIAAGDKLSVDGGHLNYEEKFNQQGDLKLHHGSLKAADLILGGQSHNDLANGFVDAAHIKMEQGHELTTDAVQIESKDVEREQGNWHNQGHSALFTDKYTSVSGANITNEKSPEITSPVQENKTAENAPENTTDKKEEPKPINQLWIEAKQATVGDTISGGDSTVLKINTLEYANAKFTGNVNTYADTAHIAAGTSLERDGGYSDIKKFHNEGNLSSKNHQQTGEEFKSTGTLQAEKDLYVMDNTIELANQAHVEDTAFKAKLIIDSSQLTYSGEAAFEAADYQHSGNINSVKKEGKNNLLFVKAENATLQGTAQVEKSIYEIDHLKNASDFATGSGEYLKYKTTEYFELQTKEQIDINNNVRDCDQALSGSEVNVNKAIDMHHDLSLTSTERDVNINQDITVNNLQVDSARDIKNNRYVRARKDLSMRAKRNLHNYGGKISGKNTYLKGKEVLNITAGSAKAAQFRGVKMGNSGVIESENETLIDSTEGNIENHGGDIKSGVYTQLNSAQDVHNICNETSKQGKYDIEKTYKAGEISGGAGTAETQGVGVHIEAAGKVLIDGSNIISKGDNYISGKKGVDFKARHHTAVTSKTHKSTWYGTSKKKEKTTTTVQNCNVVAPNGRNIVHSAEGNVTGVAVNFLTKGGTDVYADKKGIKFSSLITEDRSSSKTSHLWGASKHSHKESHENATPTVFAGRGITRLHAKEDVNCRGVVFTGDGNLHIKGRNVSLTRDVLNHKVRDKTRGFSVGAFGVNALSTVKNKGNLWQAAASEDQTLGKANALFHSQNTTQGLANGWNFGMSAFNTANSIASGINNNNLGAEAMARFGLGGLDGFDPTVNLNFTQTDTKAKFQTTGPGEINMRNVTIEAEDKISMDNGYQTKASEDVTLKAKTIEANAAKLHSSLDSKEMTYSVSGSAASGVAQVGVKRGQTEMHALQHENVGVSAGNKMTINADQVTGNGLTLSAHEYDGEIKRLDLKTMQDEHEVKTQSIGVNSSGMVNASQSRERGKTTNQRSGLHSTGDINGKNETFKIHEAHLDGAAITAEGTNNLNIEILSSKTQRDEIKSSAFSVTGNVNDVARVLGNEMPPNNAAEPSLSRPVIDTVNVAAARSHQIVEHDSTIYGATGTNLQVQQQNGFVNTQNAKGERVIKNANNAISIDVPLTTFERLEQGTQNITHAWNTLFPKNPVMQNVTLAVPKPVVQPETLEKSPDVIEETIGEQEGLESDLNRADYAVIDAMQADPQLATIPPLDMNVLPSITESEAQALPEIDPKDLHPGMDISFKLLQKAGEEAAEVLIMVIDKEGGHARLPAKISVKYLQYLYAFGFSVARQNGDLKEAALDVISDALISKGIQTLATSLGCSSAAGPIGWTLFTCDIMNELVVKHYDIPKIAEQSIAQQLDAREGIRQGNFFEYQCNRDLAQASQQQWQTFYATDKIAAFSSWLNNFITGRESQAVNANSSTNDQQSAAKNTLK